MAKLNLRGKNFTPGNHSEPLCRTCQFARYKQGIQASQSYFTCGTENPRSHFVNVEMFECTEYLDKRLPNQYDYEERAFILTPIGNGEFKFLPSVEERRRLAQIKNYEKKVASIGVTAAAKPEDEEELDEDLEDAFDV